MRPAVTVVSLAREVWGSERSILQLAPYLDKEGIDLTLAAPDGAFARAAAECAIRVVPLTLPPHGGVVDATPSAVSSACNAARELPRVLRGARLVNRAAAGADLVHCNSLLATMDCAVAGRLARRPTVLELHDLVRPGVSRTLLSVATRLAGTAVAVSSPVAAGLDRRAAARVRLVPQAVDPERFAPGPADPRVRRALTAAPDDGADPGCWPRSGATRRESGRPGANTVPLVAVVGRIDPEKGVHRVVDAVAALRGRGIRCSLAVVGEPSAGHEGYAETVRADATRLLGRDVVFTGRRGDVDDVLRAVDVLVHAADAEPFGLSVLEAQACGRAVVCARSGGIPDFVADGVTGLLYRPGDVPALATALGVAVTWPQLRERLGQAAAAQASARFGAAARAGALADVYREAIGATRAAG